MLLQIIHGVNFLIMQLYLIFKQGRQPPRFDIILHQKAREAGNACTFQRKPADGFAIGGLNFRARAKGFALHLNGPGIQMLRLTEAD